MAARAMLRERAIFAIITPFSSSAPRQRIDLRSLISPFSRCGATIIDTNADARVMPVRHFASDGCRQRRCAPRRFFMCRHFDFRLTPASTFRYATADYFHASFLRFVIADASQLICFFSESYRYIFLRDGFISAPLSLELPLEHFALFDAISPPATPCRH